VRTSPPSLSRAIRLLERELGYPLFERKGRRIALNERGRELLEFVRNAMRLVDDGLAVDRAHVGGDLVRVHCSEDIAGPLVGPVFAVATATQPAARLEVTPGTPADEIVPRLLRGQLDLALVFDAQEDARVRIQLIGEIPYQVYCGAAHPLARVESPTMDQIL